VIVESMAMAGVLSSPISSLAKDGFATHGRKTTKYPLVFMVFVWTKGTPRRWDGAHQNRNSLVVLSEIYLPNRI